MLRRVSDTLGPFPLESFRRLEMEAGASLPPEYREFLQRHNGGRPEPAWFRISWQGQSWARRFPFDWVDWFFGLREEDSNDLRANLRYYRDRIPEGTIPIGCDPGGNLLLLGIVGSRQGNVMIWVRDYEGEEGEAADYGNVGMIADGFGAFIESLYDQEL
jgi:hypothetical protein